MNWRFFGAAAIVYLILPTVNAQSTLAQKSINLAARTSVPAPRPEAAPEPGRPGHALIVVGVLEDSGTPFGNQAVAQLWSEDAPPVYSVTQQGARASFDGLQSHHYMIRVSAAGYETAEQHLETFPNDTYYQAIFRLKRKPSPPTEDLSSLEPKQDELASKSATPAPGVLKIPSHSWRPNAVDQETVTIADGIVCPTATVLDRAMQRADELVQNANRFAATEQVLHEDLDDAGKVLLTERQKFDYVVSITQLSSGDLDVDEFRNGSEGHTDFPAHIATLGLPSLAFLFHERYRNDYNFDCRGLSEWRGHATWLLDFRQKPDRKSRIRGYNVDGTLYPVSLKGRAWIAADTFEVMRMEADTMKPISEIRLRGEHQAIEYAPVHFRTVDTELWLPARADLYFDFRNHKYHRVHTFSSYLLFSVSATEKIGMPKELSEK